MTEKRNRDKIMKYLKTLKPDGFFFPVVQGRRSIAGVPDIVGVYKGRFVAFEVKSDTGKTSKIQDYIINKIRRAGGSVTVVRSVNDARGAINDIIT